MADRSPDARKNPTWRWGEIYLAKSDADTLLAVNHLPNTGTGSLRLLMNRVFAKFERTQVGPFDGAEAKHLWSQARRDLEGDEERIIYVAGPQVGHFLERVDREATVFALLRDPVELVASAAARLGVRLEDVYGKRKTPVAWSNPQARSLAAGFLGDLPVTRGAPSDASAWRSRFVDLLSGSYEVEETGRLLEGLRRWRSIVPHLRLQVPTFNAGNASPELASPDLRARIEEALWLDLELYEQYASPSTAPRSVECTLEWQQLRIAELDRRTKRLLRAQRQKAKPGAATQPSTDPVTDDDKVMVGKEGWLFLAHDSNRVVDQITGELRLEERVVDDWDTALRSRWTAAQARSTAYACLVPPNQHCVYPEHLPDGVTLSETRPVTQILDKLRETANPAPFLYPLEHELTAKQIRPTYSPIDSHWNDWGAFVGYGVLCDELERQGAQLRRISETDLEWVKQSVRGDLGHKVKPRRDADGLVAHFRSPVAKLVSDNRVRNRGRRLEYECSAAPSSAVVFGESFGYVVIKFLAETFGRMTYIHLPEAFDESVLERQRANVAITIINERFLIRAPRGGDRSVDETIARAIERGGVLSDERAKRHKSEALRPS